MYVFQAHYLLLSIEATLQPTELYLLPETKWTSKSETKIAQFVRILEVQGKGQTTSLIKDWT